MTDQTPEQAARRERYAEALRECGVYDSEERMWRSLSAEWVKEITDAVIAVADAEQAEARERYMAGLRRADEMNNALMEEVQRYADGTERPVLWSVYNEMHKRALTAEARADAMERAMESTAADALAHLGCHRDLMGQCLRAERAEAVLARIGQMADAWEQRLPEVIRTPAVVSAIRAAMEGADGSRLAEAPQPETQAGPFVPPTHYRGRDGTAYCVHATPVGPDSCRECRELAAAPAVVAQPGKETDGPEVVAYRNSHRPGVLLCLEHGGGWAGLTPLTAEDLPDGGLCTYGDPADPHDTCGVDVLIPQPGTEG